MPDLDTSYFKMIEHFEARDPGVVQPQRYYNNFTECSLFQRTIKYPDLLDGA